MAENLSNPVVVEVPVEEPIPVVEEQEINMNEAGEGQTNNPEDVETNEDDEDFNPDEIDFSDTGEDLEVFNDLNEVGIDTKAESFKNFVSEMESIGINDPETVKKLATAIANKQKAATKPRKKADVKKELIANLTKEELGNYDSLRNVVKNAFKGTELEQEYDAVMSDPKMVRAINRIVQVSSQGKGVGTNPTPGTVAKTTSYLSLEKANELAQQSLIKLRSEGKFNAETKKQAIQTIASKLPKTLAEQFKNEQNI